jgi:glycosyltransferase involved in cell wall biosynthesis
MNNKTLVSVVMLTYGHENFIQQAVEGVLMQEFSGEIELIIANDCSPDGTDGVIKTIIENHPRGAWIKYTNHPVNMGMMNNFIWALKQAKGKYIALCEGDDYWIDPLKLQKQVDFLENNEEYTCCLTESISGIYKDDNSNFSNISTKSDISSEQILVESYFATNTFVFRNNIIDSSSNIFINAPLGDTLTLYLLSLKGKIKYFPDITGFYRKHSGGIYTGADNITKMERQIFFLELLIKNNYTKHKKLVRKLINSLHLEMAYNYAYNGKKFRAYSTFTKTNIFYYAFNIRKILKTIFHFIVK